MGGNPGLINLREAGTAAEAMLAAAYDKLLVPAFPLTEELDDLSTLRGRLRDDDSFIVVAGDVEAIAVYERFRLSRCGLIAYIVVDPAARGRGWARALLERARGDLTLCPALFGEIHDPLRMEGVADSMAATTRAQVMHRLGRGWCCVSTSSPSCGSGPSGAGP